MSRRRLVLLPEFSLPPLAGDKLARSLTALLALTAFAACGSSDRKQSLPTRDKSVQEHLDESAHHERQAAITEARARGEPAGDPNNDIECSDDPLEGVSYSGGEAYTILRPCWTGVTNPDDRLRNEAAEHRAHAAEHRAHAEALVAAEARACTGLGEAEISRSPLTRGDDIIRVEPVREGGAVRGARIVLRPVSGLTVTWLRRSLACHQARAAALGYPPKFMADCPMTLPGVTQEVEAVNDGIQVTLRAERDEIGAAVLGRAQQVLESAAKP